MFAAARVIEILQIVLSLIDESPEKPILIRLVDFYMGFCESHLY